MANDQILNEASGTLKITTRLLSTEDFQTSQQRLKLRPVGNVLNQSLGQEMTRLMEGDTLSNALEGLLTGRANLQQSLLALTSRLTDTIESALREEQLNMVKNTRINLQLEAGFLQAQGLSAAGTVPQQRGTFIVQGQVLHEGSGQPLAGVVVQAVDRDVRYDDLLGVAVSDEQGKYSIKFRAKDFREGGEGQPEIVLQVGADRRSLIHVTDQPISVENRKPVSVSILVPAEHADALLQTIAADSPAMTNRLEAIHLAMAHEQLQHVQLHALGQAFSQGLQNFRENLTRGEHDGGDQIEE